MSMSLFIANSFDCFQNSFTSAPTDCMKPCACMSPGVSVRSKS